MGDRLRVGGFRRPLEHRWYLGEVSSEEVAQGVAEALGMPLVAVREHMKYCCGRIRFFEAPMRALRQCGLPQAIVTVNPDIFSDHRAAAGLERTRWQCSRVFMSASTR